MKKLPNEVTIEVTIRDARLDGELAAVRSKIDAAFKGMGKDIPIGFDVEGMSKLTSTLHNNFDMISHDLVILRQGMANLGPATEKMATKIDNGVARAGMRWRWFGMNFWQVARTVITGAGELAAILVPATLAAGVGAFVLYQGAVEGVGRHLSALQTTAEATNSVFGKTTGDLLKVGHSFQTAQDAANPRAYQLLGAAVELDRSHFMNLAGMGLQVTDVLDRLAARIRVDMQASSGQIGILRAKAVPDLVGVGQVFGNLTHAIFSFAGKMPGVAEMILNIVNTGAKLLNWFASLPGPIVKTALGLEAAHRWGGLLARNVVGPLTGKLGDLSDKMGMSSKVSNSFAKAAKFLGGSWGWVPIAAAVVGVLLFNALSKSKDATEAWTASTNKMIGAARNVNVLNDIMKVVPENEHRLSIATTTMNRDLQATHQVTGVLSNRIGQYSGATQRAAGDVYALTKQQAGLRSESYNVLQGAALIEKAYGTNFVGALVLADQANVKLKNSMQGNSLAARENRLQIADLIAGYQAMAQPIGAIGKDMDALGIQSELQGTKVQQLNQAWDQYMQTLIGGTNGLAQMEDAIRNLKNDALGSASAFTGVQHSIGSAANKVKFSLQGMGKISSQSWQQFDQIVGTTAPQLIDWLRTAGAEGVLSQHDFTNAIRGTIAQLLPFAAHSKAATAELDALAQQAGGPTTSNIRVLKAWVDKGHVSMKDLRDIIGKTTVKMGDMSQVAENLGAVVQADITNQMGKAKLAFFGVNGAIETFTSDLKNDGASSEKTKTAYDRMRDALEKATGSQRAGSNMAKAYAGQLGYVRSQTEKNFVATKAWRQQLDLIHPKNISVKETGTGKFSIFGQGVGTGQLWHSAKGGMVPGVGTGTSDSNPAMLSKGEFVVNAHSTSKHLGLLTAINSRKMAEGGLVGDTTGLAFNTQLFDKRFFTDFTNAMVHSMRKHSMINVGNFNLPGGFSGPGGGAPAANAMLARAMFHPSAADWSAWNYVAMRESGWNQFATNPTSGAYGIPQSLPFTKMPRAAWPAWAGGSSNPAAQIAWMWNYMRTSYGGPQGAAAHEASHNWYGSGLKGGVFTKPTLIGVGDRGAERVDVTPIGGRGGTPVMLELAPGFSGAFEMALAEIIRKFVRVRGGNVQKVFGKPGS